MKESVEFERTNKATLVFLFSNCQEVIKHFMTDLFIIIYAISVYDYWL